ncbi:hypothetical protein OF83DRAFT_1168273 [Amylostereum chailletii]|nr:hypothetical protein OF83DRAFT_1168273 [Amylostereum chailletii]
MSAGSRLSFTSSSSASSRGTRSPAASDHKSLTPQRKHRKMLKDGSAEVWPEDVENIFVKGLKEYWNSPWATYSRGRSRWRNQFLVDYLRSSGIDRSKKQVASHIQVLRNMWKGEPEYHLVAGGEELFQENGLLNGTPFMHHSPDSVASEISVKEEQKEADMSLVSLSPRRPDPSLCPFDKRTASRPPAVHPLDFSALDQFNSFLTPCPPLSPLDSVASSSPTVDSFPGTAFDQPSPSDAWSRSFGLPPQSTAPVLSRVAISSFSIWAEGMLPLHINLNRLVPAPAPNTRIVLRMKASVSQLSDVLSPPTLHGFQGTVSFAAPWHTSAQCITRVFTGDVCDSEETGSFEALSPSHPSGDASRPQTVTALLPDSWLSRCRWRNSAVSTRLTQQIVVDGEEIACIVYDLARPPSGPASAQLDGVREERTTAIRPPSSFTWGASPAPASRSPPQDLSMFSNYPSQAALPGVSSPGTSVHTPPYLYHSSALFS